MESSWPELPYTVLTHIIGLLGTRDVISLAKTCENWRKVASMALKSVRIDETSPYNGSWQKSNYSTWPMLSGSASHKSAVITDIMASIAEFATNLAGITDGIEHLYFSGNLIPAEAYRVLLLSQKAIRTLHVEKKQLSVRLSKDGKHSISVPKELSDEPLNLVLAEGIARHEASLEDISIWIEAGDYDYPMSFHKFVQMLGEKPEYFPNLQSLALMCSHSSCKSGLAVPTTIFHHTNLEEVSLSEEIRFAELFFERTFSKNKITKLSVKPCMTCVTRVTYHEEAYKNIFNDSLYRWLLYRYLQRGSFSNLKEMNGAVLVAMKPFSMKDMSMFIKQYPYITHIDFLNSPSCENEEKVLNIISLYGPKLFQLKGHLRKEENEHVAQYCCNLESLGVVSDDYNEDFISCLSKLKKLKKLKLRQPNHPKGLENILPRLTKLSVLLLRNSKVLDVIIEKARGMESLKLECRPKDTEDILAMMDGFVQLLEEWDGLKKLHFQLLVGKEWMDEWEGRNNWKGSEKIAKLLLKKHQGLRRLHLVMNVSIPAIRARIIEGMPRCKITFEDTKISL